MKPSPFSFASRRGQRLWWSEGINSNYNFLPVGIQNPNQIQTVRRQPTGKYLMSWFDANSIHQDKNALEWHLDSTSPSTAESVTLSYAINYDDNDSAFTVLGGNNRDGDFEFPMPNAAYPEGVPFRAIRAKLEFARGSNVFDTPDVKKLALVYKPTLETMWGWQLPLDLSRGAEGYTPAEQRDYLIQLANSKVLVPYTAKDDNDGTGIYWVFIANTQAFEASGYRDTAHWQITLAEARPSSE